MSTLYTRQRPPNTQTTVVIRHDVLGDTARCRVVIQVDSPLANFLAERAHAAVMAVLSGVLPVRTTLVESPVVTDIGPLAAEPETPTAAPVTFSPARSELVKPERPSGQEKRPTRPGAQPRRRAVDVADDE